jgi:hypothetical protein
VPPADQRLGRKRVVRCELHPPTGARHGAEPAGDDGRVLRRLVLEDAELRGAVGVEGAVPVEVVRLEVEEHRDRAAQLVHVLELEARELHDDGVALRDPPVQLRERAADVPGHRRAQHPAEELARRRLPVRAGDADEPGAQQPRAELDLAPYGDARGGDERVLARHAGALDDELDAVEEREVGVVPERAVRADDLHPAPLERRRRRRAGAGEAEDQGAPEHPAATSGAPAGSPARSTGSTARTRRRRGSRSRSRSAP